MAKTFGFDEDGTRRVVKTVRKVEGQPPAPAVGRRKRPPSSGFAQALAKADGPIANNDSGFAIIWTGEPLSESATPERVKLANRFATVADQAWLWIENNGSGWYVVAQLSNIEIDVYYLDGDLTKGGSVSATQCVWVDPNWVAGPGDPVTLFDTVQSGPAVQSDLVIAWKSPKSNRLEIIELPSQLPFEAFYLNDYLPKGGHCGATLLQPNGGDATVEWIPTGADITVYDTNCRFGPAGQTKRGVCAYIAQLEIGFVFSLDESKILWAKATSNWVRVVGMNQSYVDCNLVTDSGGDTPILDPDSNPIEVRVFLPSDCAASPGSRIEPNVRTDDVIAWNYDDNGVPFCIDPKIDDRPIWTMEMYNSATAIPLRGGWRDVSDMAGRVPMGIDTGGGAADDFYEGDPSTVGATGGVTNHRDADHVFTPTGSVSGTATGSASLTGGGVVASMGDATVDVDFSDSTGTIDLAITIADHDPHYHSLSYSAATAQSGAGQPVIHSLTVDTTQEKAGGSPTSLSHNVSGSSIDAGDIADKLVGKVTVASIAAALSLSGTVEFDDIAIDADVEFDEITLEHEPRTVIQPWRTTRFRERFE